MRFRIFKYNEKTVFGNDSHGKLRICHELRGMEDLLEGRFDRLSDHKFNGHRFNGHHSVGRRSVQRSVGHGRIPVSDAADIIGSVSVEVDVGITAQQCRDRVPGILGKTGGAGILAVAKRPQ